MSPLSYGQKIAALAAVAASFGACQKEPQPAPAAAAVADPAATPAPAVEPAAAASPVVPAAAATELAAPPSPTVAAAPAEADSLAAKLDAAKAVHGGLLITADRKGIHALAPDLTLVADLSPARASQLRIVHSGDERWLFYVVPAKRQIARLDLRTGQQQVLATLPRLKNACFSGATGGADPAPAEQAPADQVAADQAPAAQAPSPAEPAGSQPAAAGELPAPPTQVAGERPAQAAAAAAQVPIGEGINPFDYLQSNADFGIDAAGRTACMQISDRNLNMANIILNYRIDLTTGKVTERVVFGGEECQTMVKGKPVVAPLCKVPDAHPAVPVAAAQAWPFTAKSKRFDADSTSASGRFSFLRDSDVVAEQGDYVYLAPFVFDAQTGAVLTITPKKLVSVDLAKLRKSKKLPADTLVTPGEAESFWLGNADVLVLSDGGAAAAPMTIPTAEYYVVRLPDSVKVIQAFAATAY
jgi:hypothetical protein